MSRVVLFAQDDHAASECLVPLSSGHRVLGVGHGAKTSIFARRCVDLGFGLANALEPEVVTGAMEKFQPELTVLVPDLEELPEAFSASTGRCYVVKVGLQMPGAPWPEFAPIWFQKDSRVAICRKDGQEVGAELVPVGKEETALSLRAKHALVASRLLQTLLEKGEGALPKLEKVDDTQEQAPKQINLKWDEEGAVCLGWAALIEERARALVQERLRPKPRPKLLAEQFLLNCPVHGQMNLPNYVKLVVDTPEFQRMRHIKQLGVCAHVFPGAKHDRYFHSIGTAHLALQFIQSIRKQQPELGISDREEVCVTLAALCHDLGHPCFSHMFEAFMRQLGKEKREEARSMCQSFVPQEVEKKIQSFETWDHEKASLVIMKKLIHDLKDHLHEVGLCVDEEGDDFELIAELIHPPTPVLRRMLSAGTLKSGWSTIMKGRRVERAWIYEIVSNWRTGIDVDKFDYMRRDALFLGIHRQWDHVRYMKSAWVISDAGVLTISPPEKDRANIRENLMELRKMLHGTAYQHKTVKKLELHMIDILKLMDQVPLVSGLNGQKMTISEAGLSLCPVAYLKLTDTFIESRLLDREDPALLQACEEYKARFLDRKLMRLALSWNLPNMREVNGLSRFQIPKEETFIEEVLASYNSEEIREVEKESNPWSPVAKDELRVAFAKLTYGMGEEDPIRHIVFHDKKHQKKDTPDDPDANPYRSKAFLFWSPSDSARLHDDATRTRLNAAGEKVAERLMGEEPRDVAVGMPGTNWANAFRSRISVSELTESSRTEEKRSPVPRGARDSVDRYIRGSLFPPHDPAVVEVPGKSETYFIESMEQFNDFRMKVLEESGTRGLRLNQRSYAADTHWYSNVGGSIVKMGDSDIHMPLKTSEKKHKAIIPGAALGARKKLRMNEPLIGPNAERYCSAALASGWIGVEGPYVKQFEKHLAQVCGCTAACAVQSGTAALYGAMKALGVSEPTHHVLVPAFTCAACADAIVHAGGRPIPIDCDLESYGVSLEAVQTGLADKNVVGIVIAPCYGVPARDFAAIQALCKERGLWLCEDACESYGASCNVRGFKVPVGSLATLSVVSVRSEKMIGVGEGGAILGNDATLVARAKWWCSRAPCRGVGLWRVYEHDAVGQNFRMPEMPGATRGGATRGGGWLAG
ncbi:Deoxynucleoside triphosphate triphosphohydrolase SAMHD1 (dNTPase) [Durusdinium trenchii]|uniref:Deoxynucleoside triphosphate triphosphohydrolase SAMHD1 (DNTPase) n=1 Tax=Durusdinium trenchii TaxID=1381693 RepID=A0ABP0INZ3_9DINO